MRTDQRAYFFIKSLIKEHASLVSAPISAAYLCCLSIHQCCLSVPPHQCRLSVPISATYQWCLSVPISAVYQCSLINAHH
ncbi:unnamed protein product [Staurois parvus]|uniref:Uncharacterized protein n=1 Tax=Staurois parvus TaxID=386267 RepID=A0ABN9GZQ6_9NEOB|nr:unnamed protein product [Staurois parvus]